MDRRTEWPWSWEEEAAWKAELEERDSEFVAELMDRSVEEGRNGASYVPGPGREEELVEEVTPEKYSITA